jgi:hypothetical protein
MAMPADANSEKPAKIAPQKENSCAPGDGNLAVRQQPNALPFDRARGEN